MWSLLVQIASAISGLWLADKYVPGVDFIGTWQILIFAGAILGAANFFLKPLLNIISLPLQIISLGLFRLVINMLMVWLVDIAFVELIITGLIPLFLTSSIIWLINYVLQKWMPAK